MKLLNIVITYKILRIDKKNWAHNSKVCKSKLAVIVKEINQHYVNC